MEARPLALAHNCIAQQMVDCHHGLAPASVTDNNGPPVLGKVSVQLSLPRAWFIRDLYFQWRTVKASVWSTGKSVLRKACASSGSSNPSTMIVSPVPRGGAGKAHAA